MSSLYKFLLAGGRSQNGNTQWKLGEWLEVSGPLELCHNGFHACPSPLAALNYVQGEILCEVEGRKEHLGGTDKECFRSMRIIRAWQWTSLESVRLAVFAAELALPNWEAKYPSDGRVRAAVDAARSAAVGGVLDREALESAGSAARSAARSAAAWSAESASARSAESSARSAAWSAAAAWSARSAARWSARSAARSARSAARWSARSAARWSASALQKIDRHIIGRIPHLAVAAL